jgi:hypothetical protein
VVLEVPPVSEWLRRFPPGHPRIYLRGEDLAPLRESRHGARRELWRQLERDADRLLTEPHELSEPPFLPDWESGYQEAFDVWYRILLESRRFVHGAQTLALAYLASGAAKYARAACQRMYSVSRWDPDGSTHISHNDEAHMSVIWHGAIACDWVWDQFRDEERAAVVKQFRRRGEITYEHMHDRGCYGVTRFDNHAGREIVFLALTALVFHQEIPAAQTWLEWLRPVLCGIWPIWAADDGAWAQGPTYGLAYVEIMTMFASALKRGAGVDLYRRPFWLNHLRWRRWCVPPYAEWIGFGDGSEPGASSWAAGADLAELVARETGANEFSSYAAELREQAQRYADLVPEQQASPVSPLQYLLAGAGSVPADAAHARRSYCGAQPRRGGAAAAESAAQACPEGSRSAGALRVFPGAGWAAIRTDLDDPSRDIALLFRSSPFGSVSHSHANNNDVIIHVAGKVMAMPSGYYDGYGSDHHVHWVWHTKSHNCLTLSDAPQLMQSHDSIGVIENAFEDDRIVYLRGTADASYPGRADRYRRHLLFLKGRSCFVMVDEFVAKPGVASAVQWNLHSWSRFRVDKEKRTFLVERGESCLERPALSEVEGHFMYHQNAFFSLSEGWEPAPFRTKPDAQWHQQYHLRFTISELAAGANLGVVLCPGHAALPRTAVVCTRAGGAEVARIGEDRVLVNQGRVMEYEGLQTDALALVVVAGCQYQISDEGVSLRDRT